MPVIPCPSCQGPLSTSAAACPRCGYAKRKTSCLTLGCGGLFALVVIPMAIVSATSSRKRDTPSAALAAMEAPATLADVKVTDFSWTKAGFGNVMEATFTIRNNSPLPIKDVEVIATHSAPSGTIIDSNTRTIFEAWEPGETRTVSKFNMGFVHAQATKSGVVVKSFTVITPGGPARIP